LFANLRRAWFLHRLRRVDEEPPPGSVPHLDFRQRRMIKAVLDHPEQDWTLNAIWYQFLLTPVTVAELGEKLSAAGLASVVWVRGERCLVVSELGTDEFPTILALYRSQALPVVLLRDGPKAAGAAWLQRHRDRVWRRRRKHELPPSTPSPSSRSKGDESGHDGDGPGSGLLW
jgi:hypothetical protein